MKTIGHFFVWLNAACLVLGYFPNQHPAFDSLALARPIFALFCLVGVLVMQTWRARMAAMIIVGFGLFTSFEHVGTPVPADDLRVYSKNLLYRNQDVLPVAADIRASNADLVLLQEVSADNVHLLETLRIDFPHQYRCQRNRTLSLIVASRLPMTGVTRCSKQGGVAAAQIMWQGTAIWAVSAHIRWHWPINSRQDETLALELLQSLDGAVVLGGDFNSFPWSDRMQRFANATETQAAGPLTVTLKHDSLLPPLPIDHILAPGGGSVTQRPLFGSDHHGILADVQLVTRSRILGFRSSTP